MYAPLLLILGAAAAAQDQLEYGREQVASPYVQLEDVTEPQATANATKHVPFPSTIFWL